METERKERRKEGKRRMKGMSETEWKEEKRKVKNKESIYRIKKKMNSNQKKKKM